MSETSAGKSASITIYTKSYCPYCHAAVDLLKKKGLSFEQVEITGKKELAQEMITRSNGRSTVPQIFFGQKHIGGCDDLYALEEKGGIDKLLALA